MVEMKDMLKGNFLWYSAIFGENEYPCIISAVNSVDKKFKVITLHNMKESNWISLDGSTAQSELTVTTREAVDEYIDRKRCECAKIVKQRTDDLEDAVQARNLYENMLKTVTADLLH
jgi:hypothetical protein